jgi:cytochrome c oxidase assembly factor CtaG
MSHPVAAANGVIPPLFTSWTLDLWVVAPATLAAGLYIRGWLWLRRRVPQHLGARHLAAFLGGLVVIIIAMESPLHALAAGLLQAHMVQHLMLMMVAPPLLWLGAPLLPMLYGVPRGVLRRGTGRILAWPLLSHLGRWLVYPPVAWVLYVGSTWAWHTPMLYERALAAERWHEVQHACFLGSALVFWWPVVQPWPSLPLSLRWAIVPYLMLADLQNTVLSAWLVFAERVLYPSYTAIPRPWGIPALADQAAAGAIMWVPGSVAFLLPMAWAVCQLLAPKGPHIAVPGRQPLGAAIRDPTALLMENRGGHNIR